MQCIRDGRHKKSTGKIIHTRTKSVLISPGLIINAMRWFILTKCEPLKIAMASFGHVCGCAPQHHRAMHRWSRLMQQCNEESHLIAHPKRKKVKSNGETGKKRVCARNRSRTKSKRQSHTPDRMLSIEMHTTNERTNEQRTEEQRKINLFSSSSALARVFECACDRCTNIFLFKLSYLFAYKKNHTLVQEVRELMQKK